MDITGAINSKLIIRFRYDGHERVVIPAAYGMHATTNNSVLRGYQIGGTSSSRSVPLWDLFLVDKIANFEVTEDHFDQLPPYYKRDDKNISPLFAQL